MTIPCKDCLTFVMCKSQYDRCNTYSFRAANMLYNKCSILKEYLIENSNPQRIKYSYVAIPILKHIQRFYSKDNNEFQFDIQGYPNDKER